MKYDLDLVNSMIESARESINNRRQRINDGQTDMDDCFISQRCNEQQISKANMIKDIIEAGGRYEMSDLKLYTLDGQLVDAKICTTQYGTSWRIKTDSGIKWLSAYPQRRSTHERKGYVMKHYIYETPVMVVFKTSNSGMMGVYTGQYGVVPCDYNLVTERNEEKKFIRTKDYVYKSDGEVIQEEK